VTRSELVQRLTQLNSHLTVAQAEKSVSIILDEITSALTKGYRVELRGFGVFTTRDRRSRLGRNPRTGQPVKVEPKKVPFFKAGKQLRDRLNTR
jgi:integration host factor subunit beta